MTKLFKHKEEVSRFAIESIPKEVVEKRTIMYFLEHLPLGSLKQLTNFHETKCDEGVKYTCEMYLDCEDPTDVNEKL